MSILWKKYWRKYVVEFSAIIDFFLTNKRILSPIKVKYFRSIIFEVFFFKDIKHNWQRLRYAFTHFLYLLSKRYSLFIIDYFLSLYNGTNK